jgi:hypothetical protein
VLAASSVGAYTAALIAAGSAVVGGLLTAGSNLLIEERRRKHRDDAVRTQEQAELRQATRLVLAELAEIVRTIGHFARSRRVWPSERQLPSAAWEQFRTVLAPSLPLSTWRWLCAAYDFAKEVNLEIFERHDQAIDSNDVEWLRQPFRTTYHAIEELETVLGESEDPFYSYRGRRSMEELEADAFRRQEPETKSQA